LQLAVSIADFVHISRKREPHIVLDVETGRGIFSGVSARYIFVLLNMMLSIVDCAGNRTS